MHINFRSVTGVISTVIGLTIIIYMGSIVFYRVYGVLDTSNLNDQWMTLLVAVYDFYGLGISVMMFLFILCILAPLLWVFLGHTKNGGDML